MQVCFWRFLSNTFFENPDGTTKKREDWWKLFHSLLGKLVLFYKPKIACLVTCKLEVSHACCGPSKQWVQFLNNESFQWVQLSLHVMTNLLILSTSYPFFSFNQDLHIIIPTLLCKVRAQRFKCLFLKNNWYWNMAGWVTWDYIVCFWQLSSPAAASHMVVNITLSH